MNEQELAITVNETNHELRIQPRRLLSDVLREELGLTGTKRGCDTAKCGACTVLLNGEPVKSCNLLALQADGDDVTTIEGIRDDELTDLQQSFWENLGFQCGYCTPGFIMSATALLADNPDPTETEIRDRISGNICRCTGYMNIVKAIEDTAEARRDDDG